MDLALEAGDLRLVDGLDAIAQDLQFRLRTFKGEWFLCYRAKHMASRALTLVLISDTQGMHEQLRLPPGDVLVHAGDVTGDGAVEEVESFLEWFDAQPYEGKVFVAGNHDYAFARHAAEAKSRVPAGVAYLEDSGAVVCGLSFWGTPWVPFCCTYERCVFNQPNREEMARVRGLIPNDTRVLIAHSPPKGILDRQARTRASLGCDDLAQRIKTVRPRLVVFGHVHNQYGQTESDGVTYVNACCCDDKGTAIIHRPTIVELQG